MRSFNSGQTNGVANNVKDLLNYTASISQNTSTANLQLLASMINDSHRYLLEKYFFNESSFTITTIGDQQGYPLPYDYSKLKTSTITDGNLRWNPTEILTRREWDDLNVFPYYSDIPVNFFIYNSQLNFWPIPSTGSTNAVYNTLVGTLTSGDIITQGSATGKLLTFTATNMVIAVTSQTQFSAGAFTDSTSGATGVIASTTITPGNTITYNYKRRVTDLTFTDYTTGTVLATNGSNVITGTGTDFVANYLAAAGNVFALNLWLQVTAPGGDGNWYQINSIDSATQVTLVNQYQGSTTVTTAYTIGQIPLLLEDFQDLLAYRPLMIYFSSINKDPQKAEVYKALYDEGIKIMDDYVGSKSLNVNLARTGTMRNPNLYWQGH